MKIRFLAVGRLKRPAFTEVAQDYIQRIQKYHRLEIVEIPEEGVKQKSDVDAVLQKESRRIEKYISPHSYLIALDEKGSQFSSVDLAWELGQRFNDSSFREIIFLIGGSYGLDPALKAQAKLLWSLSKLTLPHHLARVLALEQIYRAFTILRNVPYHHE